MTAAIEERIVEDTVEGVTISAAEMAAIALVMHLRWKQSQTLLACVVADRPLMESFEDWLKAIAGTAVVGEVE